MDSVVEARRIREIERRAYVAGYAEDTAARRGYPLSREELDAVEAEAVTLYPDSVDTAEVEAA